MSEDATLSDFQSAGEDDGCDVDDVGDERDVDDVGDERDEEEAGGVTDDPATDADPESADDEPDPAVSTYAWGEYACDRCGERTERAWRDEEALVCPACKSW